MYPITERCIEFARGLVFEDLSPFTVNQMKMYLLDCIGCGVGGAKRPVAGHFHRYIADRGGNREAVLFGRGEKASVDQAAFFNAAVSHALEMDDSDREAFSHPGIMVIPPVLALAEKTGASGRDVITACVAGYEIMLRLGAAVGAAHYAIWHTTGTTGVFGAAIAAGKLLGLDKDQLGHAFGNAGTMAAGLWQFNQSGAMSKVLHAGHGARDGVMAACMAQTGFTGADGILEGSQGFFAGYAPGGVKKEVFDDFGSFWRSDGVSFKPYPCCRHTHGAIDCALLLRDDLADKGYSVAADVASVRIESYAAALQVADNPGFSTTGAAKFSIRYCVAAALAHGVLEEKHFHAPYLRDPVSASLAACAGTEVNPALEAVHPYHEGSRVTLALRDGSSLSASVDDPLGDPERPLSWDALCAKFDALTGELMPPATRQAIQDAVRETEALDTWRRVAALLA